MFSFSLTKKKQKVKTKRSATHKAAPRSVGLALGFQTTMVTQIRGRCPRMVRTESFLSQAGQPMRQEKLWVGIRGGFLQYFFAAEKSIK